MKKQPQPVTPLLMSRTAAAQSLGLSERSVDLLIRSDRLACVKIGKRILIPSAAVVDFAAHGCSGSIRSTTNNTN